MKELQDEGKIRHIGVSNVSVEQLEQARAIVDVVSVQHEYGIGGGDDGEYVLDFVHALETAGLADATRHLLVDNPRKLLTMRRTTVGE